MMPAASRIGDAHRCTIGSHVGGKITSGCPTVFIGGKPAARIGDVAACEAPAFDEIEEGFETVIIGNRPAARRGDATHGGVLTGGDPTVLIGPSAFGGAALRALRKGTDR
jgi:uncharacterized Zn-binding protein involved in type VI secretion